MGLDGPGEGPLADRDLGDDVTRGGMAASRRDQEDQQQPEAGTGPAAPPDADVDQSYAPSVVILVTSGKSTPAAAFEDERGVYHTAPSLVMASLG